MTEENQEQERDFEAEAPEQEERLETAKAEPEAAGSDDELVSTARMFRAASSA